MLATDLMQTEPRTIDVDASLSDALEAFSASGQRVLPVLSGGRLVGLLSAGDVRALLAPEGLTISEQMERILLSMPISDFHTVEGKLVTPAMTVRELVQRILDHQLPELPVVAEDSGALLGLVSSERVLSAAREGWA